MNRIILSIIALLLSSGIAFSAMNSAPGTGTVTPSTTDTFTNKTMDTGATGNVLKIGGAPVTAAEYDAGDSSTSLTLDFANGIHQKVTMTDSCTFTFTAPATGIASLTIKLVQGGSGSYTATFPSTVFWAAGTAPTLSTSVGKVDMIACYYDGTDYMCNPMLDLRHS